MAAKAKKATTKAQPSSGGWKRKSAGVYEDAQGNIVHSKTAPTKPFAAKKSGSAGGGKGGATTGATQSANPAIGSFDPNDANSIANADWEANHKDQSGTFGNFRYDENGNLIQSLSDTEQGKYNQEVGLEGQANTLAGQALGSAGSQYADGLNYGGLGELPQGFDANMAARGKLTDSLYEGQARRLDTRFKNQSDDFEQRMANQGIPVGSKIYNEQKAAEEQNKNDAYQSARDSAEANAASQFGVVSNAALANRSQGAGEVEKRFAAPISAAQGLMGLGTGVIAPSQMQTPGSNIGGIAGLGQSASQFDRTQQQNMDIARMNNSTARSTAPQRTDPFALAQFQTDQAIRRDNNTAQINNQFANRNRPTSGQQLAGVGGAFLGSFAQGAGQGLAKGWFS